MCDDLLEVSENTWIKLWRRCLRPGSGIMRLSEANRWRFIVYVMLARSQSPFRGCLCAADGRPYSRQERAELLGISFSACKAAEEAMLAAGLIAFEECGGGHPAALGRLHITNYAHYQNGDPWRAEGETLGEPRETLGEPRETLGEPRETLGEPRDTLGEPRDNPW
ncbi:MAG: hypothetical protein AB7Y46_01695, partial [Armatimonadota bacterium]